MTKPLTAEEIAEKSFHTQYDGGYKGLICHASREELIADIKALVAKEVAKERAACAELLNDVLKDRHTEDCNPCVLIEMLRNAILARNETAETKGGA